MTQSMTGYARAEGQFQTMRIVWRLRSVNQRFLDLSLRMPDFTAALEPKVRQILKGFFARGRIECALTVEPDDESALGINLNEERLDALLAMEARLINRGGHAVERRPMGVAELLAWPGVVEEQSTEQSTVVHGDAFTDAVMALLQRAADELKISRQSEGGRLDSVIQGLLDQLHAQVAQVEALIPQVRERQESRLRERLEDTPDLTVDESRLAQEIVYLFNRMDIDEEIDRLKVHLAEMRDALKRAEPVGRRLDFLCQELNREANTLCSKPQDSGIAQLGVGMKVTVEKLREQVQNLE